MNKGQVFLFLVYSSLCLSYSAHGHPVHATFAEAQWNPKTFELELSLRVRGIDLESAISKTTNQKVDLEKSKNIDQLIEGYLAKNLYILSPTKEKVFANYLDKDVGITNTWVFFSFTLKKDQAIQHCKIINTIFFDDLEGQKNVIEYRKGKLKKIISFEENTREGNFQFEGKK